MRVVVVTPPEPVVSLDEAKRHLRVDAGDDDAYVEGLIAVATAWLDAPSGWLGRALGEQVLEARLPLVPAGEERDYPYPPFLALVDEAPHPDGRTVVAQWRAGYAAVDGKGTVPTPIRHAILLMVGHLYANRDAVATGGTAPAVLPFGVEALLSPYRVWRI